MSSFYVEPTQLAGLARMLERLAEDARVGDRYVLGNTGTAGGEGWLNDLSGAHESVVNQTRQWVQSLEEAYPPPDYNDHGQFRYQPSYWDVVSIASLGRDAILKATEFLARMGMLDRAYDPYELVLKPVVGDRAGFRRAADVYRNVAQALIFMSNNLYHARVSLPSVWRGNAADGCNVHLDRLSKGILDGYAPLHRIADEYEKAAQGRADFRVTVAQLISDLIRRRHHSRGRGGGRFRDVVERRRRRGRRSGRDHRGRPNCRHHLRDPGLAGPDRRHHQGRPGLDERLRAAPGLGLLPAEAPGGRRRPQHPGRAAVMTVHRCRNHREEQP
ncbi:MAG: hypothetical protein FWJ87_13455 [Micromonosporaceae bacterium]